MKLEEITEIKSHLPSIRSIDNSNNQIAISLPAKGITAFYSYDQLITYKQEIKPRILTSKWDYCKTTTKYLSQYLGKNKAEIKQAIANFEFILEDNPCLT